MSKIERIADALRAGKLAVLPTDTVYGLVCTAASEEAAAALYRLKGRDAIQPTAIVAASVEALLAAMPELEGETASRLRAVLPGPFTLVVPNPERRFEWLCGENPRALGVRVPNLSEDVAGIVAGAGVVVATSANLPGGPDPRTLADVPQRIRDGVVAAVDGGELPGVASTVIDLSSPTPVVLRRGAGDIDGALELISATST